MRSISVPLAFLAGLLSFVSPCVLPLVRGYLGYLSGSSLTGDSPPKRWQVFRHALLFVGGFTLVFVVLFGLPTTLFSDVLLQYRDWISKIGGAILVLFGLHKVGVFTIPILNRTRRLEVGTGIDPGYLRSILFGVTFGVGWTPCIGPLLGAVLTMALTEPSRGAVLTLVYALGLAVPFLATAALLARGVGWLKRLNRHLRAIEIASGLLMIGVGILLITGMFGRLGGWLTDAMPEWLRRSATCCPWCSAPAFSTGSIRAPLPCWTSTRALPPTYDRKLSDRLQIVLNPVPRGIGCRLCP